MVRYHRVIMMNKKTTIYDIAEKLNVSAVTVHRALTNKGRISAETKKKILATAENMGYKVNVAAQVLHRATIKIIAVVYCPVDEYVDSIIQGMNACGEELEKFNVEVTVIKIPFSNGKHCLEQTCNIISEYSDAGVDGFILFLSSMTDEIKELLRVVRKVKESKNIPFATVANAILKNDCELHVGIDTEMAGSMAAELLSLSCRGEEIALFVSSKTSPVNKEYIDGFLKYAGDNTFSKIHIIEHFDDKEKVIEKCQQMRVEMPNLRGIYMTTASSTLACKYIDNPSADHLTIITTDLLSDTPDLLRKKIASATIFQSPYKQGRNVVRYLYNYLIDNTDGGLHLIAPKIVLSSNLSSYLFDESTDSVGK